MNLPLSTGPPGALKEYAALEHEVFLLFKFLIGTEAEIASSIFYQMVSARTRYAIIASLLDIQHRMTFGRARDHLQRWLGCCDTARNHIIHQHQSGYTIVSVNVPTGEKDPRCG